MLRQCLNCGLAFKTKRAVMLKGNGRYCSAKCYGIAMRRSSKANAWRYQDKSGRWQRCWRIPGKTKIYRMAESRWVWEQAFGEIPEGYDIHHLDHDHENNNISNLVCISSAKHNEYHQRVREDHRKVNGVEQRRCQKCLEYKDLNLFSIRTAGTYSGYCKPCAALYSREWRNANR